MQDLSKKNYKRTLCCFVQIATPLFLGLKLIYRKRVSFLKENGNFIVTQKGKKKKREEESYNNGVGKVGWIRLMD